jgi:hypothetical protein
MLLLRPIDIERVVCKHSLSSNGLSHDGASIFAHAIEVIRHHMHLSQALATHNRS